MSTPNEQISYFTHLGCRVVIRFIWQPDLGRHIESVELSTPAKPVRS